MKKYSSNVIGQLTGNIVFLGYFETEKSALDCAIAACMKSDGLYASPFASGPFLVIE